MTKKTIAVLGISGVGKTTMISTFTRNHPQVHSVRASDLLKNFLSVADSEELRTDTSDNINANQHHLSLAILDLHCRYRDCQIIFDGHSVIDNDRELVIVPVSVFESLSPDMIIFLEDDPHLIFQRRIRDNSRSRPQRSLEQIDFQQKFARDTALNYGDILSKPVVFVKSGDHMTFNSVIKEHFSLDGSKNEIRDQ